MFPYVMSTVQFRIIIIKNIFGTEALLASNSAILILDS